VLAPPSAPVRAAPLSAPQHSLVSWLVLQGVSVEITNNSTGYALSAPPAAPALRTDNVIHTPPTQSKTITPQTYDSLDLLYIALAAAEFPLARTATHMVRGTGQTDSPALMIIGEAPETADDLSGLAFDGPSGRMIQTAVRYAGFDAARCYATFLSKWRTPGQRPLYATEVSSFAPFLLEEIRLVNPSAILLLGDVVSRLFLADNVGGKITLRKKTNIEIQSLGKSLPILTSQKGEFLVKNKGMKKGFWFSLIDLAETTRESGL
jgi:uracil-DNA glycosylase family 4